MEKIAEKRTRRRESLKSEDYWDAEEARCEAS